MYIDWIFGVVLVFQYGFEFFAVLFIPCFGYVEQMAFYGFPYGVCIHTLNLASAAWVLYSPTHDLVGSGAFCVGPTKNNITEYHAVIGLLTRAASRDIDHLVVFMDSHLVFFHLNHVYAFWNPTLLCMFQRVCFLEISFESITYQHIPRSCNIVADSLANYILD